MVFREPDKELMGLPHSGVWIEVISGKSVF